MNVKPSVETIQWVGGTDGHLVLIDQTLLPTELKYLECRETETVWEAIKMLRVRGAPAIGIAAAYGCVVGLQSPGSTLIETLNRVADYLATSRPTAVNLFWALDRMRRLANELTDHSDEQIREKILAEAKAIHEEDRAMCHAIGKHGFELLNQDVRGVLTHCNAGGLATAEYGTALSVFLRRRIRGTIYTYTSMKPVHCSKVLG